MLSALQFLATTPAVDAPAGEGWEHPFEPIVFGFITFGIFLALLLILFLFRNTLALPAHRDHGTTSDEHAEGDDGALVPTAGRETH